MPRFLILRARLLLALVWILTFALLLGGCQEKSSDSAGHGHDHDPDHVETVSAWNSQLEVFLEHPPLVANQPVRLVFHLTHLPQGTPVAGGPVNLVWSNDGDQAFTRVIRVPVQPGIFVTEVDLPQAGTWDLVVSTAGGGLPLVISGFKVFASDHDAMHHGHPASHEEGEVITMTKEQQWRLEVASAPVERSTYTQPLRIAARVESPPTNRVVVSTTVAGRVSPLAGSSLPVLGQEVAAGQPLLAVNVPLTGDAADLMEAETELIRTAEALRLAETEADRAASLQASGAASLRRVEEADAALAEARARHQAASRVLQGGEPARVLTAPMSGVIVSLDVSEGQFLEAGQAAVTILDPDLVWVRGHVPETALADLPASPRARLGVHGNVNEACHIEGSRLVYLAPEIDPVTRTVAVVYEVENHGLHLRPGQTLGLILDTNTVQEGLVIPVEALVDEHGRPVVFVQVDGENFVKRHLELGGQDGTQALVTRGLAVGDRVVIQSPWAVKLAGVDTATPGHGHTH